MGRGAQEAVTAAATTKMSQTAGKPGEEWSLKQSIVRVTCFFLFFRYIREFSLLVGKEMAAHSWILAWRIPGTEWPGGLLSVGSHRVGYDWSNLAAAANLLEAEQMFYWLLNIRNKSLLFIQGDFQKSSLGETGAKSVNWERAGSGMAR